MRAKCLIIVLCAALVVVASLAVLFRPSVPDVAVSAATEIAGAAIGPAIAVLKLITSGFPRW